MNKKKNILMIMADQLTPFMLGAYGNSEVISPNLDRLARESCCYECAYTSNPLCTPARASLMTGKYTGKLNCYDNSSSFLSEEPTFVHYLNNLGYETALSGKMHFVGPDQLHGFAKRFMTDIYPSDYSWLPHYVDEKNHILQSNQWGNAIHYNAQTAAPAEWNEGLQYDEETHTKAREYLYQRGKEDTPFFLCVSYHHPHDPFNPPRRYWDMYENRKITVPDLTNVKPEGDTILDRWLNFGFHRTDVFDIRGEENLYAVRRAYSALVTYIDDKVGELLNDLKELGLEDDTIVIFTSDHGDMLGERGMVQKRCFYEWSSRIPLFICEPGKTGMRISSPVSLVDLAPTIVNLAGGKMKDADGVSLTESGEKRTIFCESHGEAILWPCYMARDERYKFVYIHEKEEQLFDLCEDPKEEKNLINNVEYREIAEKLKKQIFKTFDPEKVKRQLAEGLAKKEIVRASMERTGTSWDYFPYVDESKRFSRRRVDVGGY